MKNINVTVWCENRHDAPYDVRVPLVYPEGLHKAIQTNLEASDLTIRTAVLDSAEQGLPDEVLESTDVLIWWGHCAHEAVTDELVSKIQVRALAGMGLVLLHSSHYSKLFRKLMGTTCKLSWREVGEKERVWTVNSRHPIARGIPETFVIPNSEMYGEPFDIPTDGEVVFMSWFEGGNVFRSGIAFRRGHGRLFYFSPGHETYPIYHDETVIQIIGNAVRWVAPERIEPARVTYQPESMEEIRTIQPK